MNASVPSPERSRTGEAEKIALRGLVRAYLRMSFRGSAARTIARRRGNPNRAMIVLVAFNLFIGICLGASAFGHPGVFTYSIVLHAVTLVLVGLSVMSESAEILFSASEAEVLGAAPILPRTLLLAKTVNVFAFAFLLASALNLFGAFFGLAAEGARWWFPFAHMASTVLASAFCAAAVVFVDAVAVRLVSRERFDEAIVWLQVAMTVLFVLAYQYVPRLVRQVSSWNLEDAEARLLLFPPAWFAGFDALLGGPAARRETLALAAIGLVVTAGLGVLAVQRLSGGFARGLARLAEAGAAPSSEAKESARARTGTARRNPLLRRWIRDPVERAAFDLASIALRRDREVKLRVYPALAVFVIVPAMAILDPSQREMGIFRFLAFWFTVLLSVGTVENLRFSSNHPAAEIFRAAPLRSAAPLFHGFRKAVLLRVAAPLAAVSVVLTMAMVPDRAKAAATSVAILLLLPTFSLAAALTGPYVPFSKPPTRGARSAGALGLWTVASFAPVSVFAAVWTASRLHVLWYFAGAVAIAVVPLHRAVLGLIGRMEMPR